VLVHPSLAPTALIAQMEHVVYLMIMTEIKCVSNALIVPKTVAVSVVVRGMTVHATPTPTLIVARTQVDVIPDMSRALEVPSKGWICVVVMEDGVNLVRVVVANQKVVVSMLGRFGPNVYLIGRNCVKVLQLGQTNVRLYIVW